MQNNIKQRKPRKILRVLEARTFVVISVIVLFSADFTHWKRRKRRAKIGKESKNCIFLNEYGNYVVQKALNLANEEKKILLFKYIIQASQKLNNFPFGNKLISKLLKNYPKLSMYIGYN